MKNTLHRNISDAVRRHSKEGTRSSHYSDNKFRSDIDSIDSFFMRDADERGNKYSTERLQRYREYISRKTEKNMDSLDIKNGMSKIGPILEPFASPDKDNLEPAVMLETDFIYYFRNNEHLGHVFLIPKKNGKKHEILVPCDYRAVFIAGVGVNSDQRKFLLSLDEFQEFFQFDFTENDRKYCFEEFRSLGNMCPCRNPSCLIEENHGSFLVENPTEIICEACIESKLYASTDPDLINKTGSRLSETRKLHVLESTLDDNDKEIYGPGSLKQKREVEFVFDSYVQDEKEEPNSENGQCSLTESLTESINGSVTGSISEYTFGSVTDSLSVVNTSKIENLETKWKCQKVLEELHGSIRHIQKTRPYKKGLNQPVKIRKFINFNKDVKTGGIIGSAKPRKQIHKRSIYKRPKCNDSEYVSKTKKCQQNESRRTSLSMNDKHDFMRRGPSGNEGNAMISKYNVIRKQRSIKRKS